MKTFILSFVLLCTCSFLFAQENADSTIIKPGLSADIVSRYVWRGMALSSAPNIQPGLNVSFYGVTIGSWGSYSLVNNYAEIDLYASYSLKGATVTINDYYTENEADYPANDYLNFRNPSTNHAIELMAGYELPGRFPLSCSVATIISGNDKKQNGDNAFSTYFELTYPIAIGRFDVALSTGFTTHEGMYNQNGAAFVSAAVAIERTVCFNDQFKVPLSCSFIMNPYEEDVYLIFALQL